MTDKILHWVPWLPPWSIALGYFLAVVVIAMGIQAVLIGILNRASTRSSVEIRRFLRRTKSAMRLGIVLLGAAIAFPLLPFPQEAETVAQRFLTAAFILLSGWIAIIATRIAVDHYLDRFQIDAADNLQARKATTQFRVLRRVFASLVFVVTVGLALMTFPSARQFGISLFASAGVIGIVVGLAAQPTIGNLLAGIQLAITQPIRIDDVVIVEGEWGWIEEITTTYVVVRIWDLRRLVVPLSYFLQQPFENWTRTSAKILGTVYFYVDYTMSVDAIRTKLAEIVEVSEYWDGDVASIVVTDCKETTMEVRALVSAADSGKAWNLRCEIREKILAFLHVEHPGALPRQRADFTVSLEPRTEKGGDKSAAAGPSRNAATT